MANFYNNSTAQFSLQLIIENEQDFIFPERNLSKKEQGITKKRMLPQSGFHGSFQRDLGKAQVITWQCKGVHQISQRFLSVCVFCLALFLFTSILHLREIHD